MNLNFSPVSFSANLSYKRDLCGHGKTKAQMIDTYDREIGRIKAQKNRALQLDSFMRSDEVGKLLEALPESGVVEMRTDYKGDPESRMGLLYIDEEEGVASGIFATDPDSGVDKKGIIEWLQKLVIANN